MEIKDPNEIKSELLKLASEYYKVVRPGQRKKDYIPVSGKRVGEEELINLINASLDLWLTSGRFNAQFEDSFSKFLGVKFASTVCSGSSANLVALTALSSPLMGERRLKPGDEVITVAAGFPTTINPIFQQGLVPVFVDSELDTYNIDASKIELSLTKKTKAIMVAHTLGHMYDMDKIVDICKRHDLFLIEDSCDALGARWLGKLAGTFGDISTFSFYPAHHITMGEGGCVVTSNPLLHKAIRSVRDWGRDCCCPPGADNTCGHRFDQNFGMLPPGYDHKYVYSHMGFNLKISDFQAACGLAQLQKLQDFLEQRKKNASTLFTCLKGLEDFLILPKVDQRCDPSWFGFLISVRPGKGFSKHDITTYLEEHGVGTRELFAGNYLRQPVMKNFHLKLRVCDGPDVYSDDLTEVDLKDLKNADFIMNNTFWIGVAQNLSEFDEIKSASVIQQFFKDRF